MENGAEELEPLEELEKSADLEEAPTKETLKAEELDQIVDIIVSKQIPPANEESTPAEEEIVKNVIESDESISIQDVVEDPPTGGHPVSAESEASNNIAVEEDVGTEAAAVHAEEEIRESDSRLAAAEELPKESLVENIISKPESGGATASETGRSLEDLQENQELPTADEAVAQENLKANEFGLMPDSCETLVVTEYENLELPATNVESTEQGSGADEVPSTIESGEVSAFEAEKEVDLSETHQALAQEDLQEKEPVSSSELAETQIAEEDKGLEPATIEDGPANGEEGEAQEIFMTTYLDSLVDVEADKHADFVLEETTTEDIATNEPAAGPETVDESPEATIVQDEPLTDEMGPNEETVQAHVVEDEKDTVFGEIREEPTEDEGRGEPDRILCVLHDERAESHEDTVHDTAASAPDSTEATPGEEASRETTQTSPAIEDRGLEFPASLEDLAEEYKVANESAPIEEVVEASPAVEERGFGVPISHEEITLESLEVDASGVIPNIVETSPAVEEREVEVPHEVLAEEYTGTDEPTSTPELIEAFPALEDTDVEALSSHKEMPDENTGTDESSPDLAEASPAVEDGDAEVPTPDEELAKDSTADDDPGLTPESVEVSPGIKDRCQEIPTSHEEESTVIDESALTPEAVEASSVVQDEDVEVPTSRELAEVQRVADESAPILGSPEVSLEDHPVEVDAPIADELTKNESAAEKKMPSDSAAENCEAPVALEGLAEEGPAVGELDPTPETVQDAKHFESPQEVDPGTDELHDEKPGEETGSEFQSPEAREVILLEDAKQGEFSAGVEGVSERDNETNDMPLTTGPVDPVTAAEDQDVEAPTPHEEVATEKTAYEEIQSWDFVGTTLVEDTKDCEFVAEEERVNEGENEASAVPLTTDPTDVIPAAEDDDVEAPTPHDEGTSDEPVQAPEHAEATLVEDAKDEEPLTCDQEVSKGEDIANEIPLTEDEDVEAPTPHEELAQEETIDESGFSAESVEAKDWKPSPIDKKVIKCVAEDTPSTEVSEDVIIAIREDLSKEETTNQVAQRVESGEGSLVEDAKDAELATVQEDVGEEPSEAEEVPLITDSAEMIPAVEDQNKEAPVSYEEFVKEETADDASQSPEHVEAIHFDAGEFVMGTEEVVKEETEADERSLTSDSVEAIPIDGKDVEAPTSLEESAMENVSTNELQDTVVSSGVPVVDERESYFVNPAVEMKDFELATPHEQLAQEDTCRKELPSEPGAAGAADDQELSTEESVANLCDSIAEPVVVALSIEIGEPEKDNHAFGNGAVESVGPSAITDYPSPFDITEDAIQHEIEYEEPQEVTQQMIREAENITKEAAESHEISRSLNECDNLLTECVVTSLKAPTDISQVENNDKEAPPGGEAEEMNQYVDPPKENKEILHDLVAVEDVVPSESSKEVKQHEVVTSEASHEKEGSVLTQIASVSEQTEATTTLEDDVVLASVRDGKHFLHISGHLEEAAAEMNGTTNSPTEGAMEPVTSAELKMETPVLSQQCKAFEDKIDPFISEAVENIVGDTDKDFKAEAEISAESDAAEKGENGVVHAEESVLETTAKDGLGSATMSTGGGDGTHVADSVNSLLSAALTPTYSSEAIQTTSCESDLQFLGELQEKAQKAAQALQEEEVEVSVPLSTHTTDLSSSWVTVSPIQSAEAHYSSATGSQSYLPKRSEDEPALAEEDDWRMVSEQNVSALGVLNLQSKIQDADTESSGTKFPLSIFLWCSQSLGSFFGGVKK